MSQKLSAYVKYKLNLKLACFLLFQFVDGREAVGSDSALTKPTHVRNFILLINYKCKKT